jgi:hypothetical protein
VNVEYVHADMGALALRIGIAKGIKGRPEGNAYLIAPDRRRVENVAIKDFIYDNQYQSGHKPAGDFPSPIADSVNNL